MQATPSDYVVTLILVVLSEIEAGSLRHSSRGRRAERRPRWHTKKSLRPGRGRPERWLQAPLFYAAFGMPFSGRGPVFRGLPGASRGAVPPSTMAETFGLKGCRLPRRNN